MEQENFFYANGLELAVSVFDVTLRFIRNGAAPGSVPTQGAKPVRFADFSISMSPSHAKAMMVPLVNAIREYEKAHGKIPVEAKDQQAWDSLNKAV
jgi:hypothetical protein